jgi:CBS domain-containing protein
MRARRIHHVVVTDGGRVVGVLSDRDAGGRHGARLRQHRTVGELMSHPVVAAPPTTPVRRAANLMRGRSIGCLVVTEDERPVGIVTVTDLLELLGRGLERPVTVGKRWTLKHRVAHSKRHRTGGAW